jgi:uncharacterized membrane protein
MLTAEIRAENHRRTGKLKRRKTMSLESATGKRKTGKYAAIGLIIGASIALLLSELGLEIEIAVGRILGLCIGTYIDKSRA